MMLCYHVKLQLFVHFTLSQSLSTVFNWYLVSKSYRILKHLQKRYTNLHIHKKPCHGFASFTKEKKAVCTLCTADVIFYLLMD